MIMIMIMMMMIRLREEEKEEEKKPQKCFFFPSLSSKRRERLASRLMTLGSLVLKKNATCFSCQRRNASEDLWEETRTRRMLSLRTGASSNVRAF